MPGLTSRRSNADQVLEYLDQPVSVGPNLRKLRCRIELQPMHTSEALRKQEVEWPANAAPRQSR